MKILAVIGAFAIMILFAFVCGAIIAQQTDDEKIREDLEQEEWLSKLKRRKEKKNRKRYRIVLYTTRRSKTVKGKSRCSLGDI